MRRPFRLQTHFIATLTASSLLMLCGVLAYLNCLLKDEAIDNAQKIATLLAYQKLATRAYLSTVDTAAAPSFVSTEPTSDRFRMPASELIARFEREFHKLDQENYFRDFCSQECSSRQCIPASETNDLERNFLTRLEEDPTLQEWHGIRRIGDREHFILMLRCEPLADNQLQAADGTLRMPVQTVRTGGGGAAQRTSPPVLSAITVGIPLSDSYSMVNHLTLQGGLFIGCLLLIVSTIHLILVRHNILDPLEALHALVTTVTVDRRHLGETISIRSSREIDELAESFNRLSITLGEHHRDLHAMIDEHTRELRDGKEKLRQSERQIRLLLDSAAEAIYGVDPDGNCTFCNPAALSLFGYDHSDNVLGRPTCNFFHHAGMPGAIADPARTAYQDGQITHIEKMAVTRPDGTTFMIELWAHPMLQEGVCHGAVVSILDITERLNLQQQGMRAAQLASVGEIATGVAHEINNPITGVINYSQYLLSKLKTGEASPQNLEEILQRIIREGNRVAVIVKNLLFFARDSGSLRTPVSIQKLLDDVFCLTGSQLESSGISVNKHLPEQPVFIDVNPQQLEQVLLNVINNARYALNEKFPVGSGEKALELTVEATDGPTGRRCRLVLHDNGIGIPADILPRLGTPFVTTKPAGVGTGLGLSISQEIIKQHGGHLTIDSRQHEYTRVVVELPLMS